jgi:HlyD family secretion protein
MRRYTSKLLWLVIALGLAGFLIYGFTPKPVDVESVRPMIGALQITIDDDGETRVREKYVVLAPVTGKMLRVNLHAGDQVVAGETGLVCIEPEDPSLLDARTRTEAEARVRVAMAAHSQAVASVDRTKEVLELANLEFDRGKKLVLTNAISQAEFDVMENRLRLAQADVRSAESAQQVARYEIDQAEAAVQFFDADYSPKKGNAFRAVAPINGIVLEVLREDAGMVVSGTPILSIGDASDLEIVLDILSTDAVKIRPHDKVLIEHWGGSSTLNAVVRRVEPSAFLKVSALGVEEKRVNVIADFVDPLEQRETLGDGFRVEARIVVDETPAESMKIPAGVLFREGDAWHVYKINGYRAELLEVQVGRSNGRETEILAGLQKDDILILHPSESIRDGTRVKY